MGEKEKGILGLGILPRGPLRRRLERRSKGEEPKVEADPLEELENSLKSYLSSLEKAFESSECSLCRELLMKIKTLSLKEQERAIPELRQFMALAETAEGEADIKKGLRRMPTLMKVMEG